MESSKIEIYQNADNKTEVIVKFEEDTAWLSQRIMAELFEKDSDTIGLHLKNIYKEGELEETSTTEYFSVVQKKGKQNDKKSILKRMPSHLKNYTTELNYLFEEIYKFYKEVKGDRSKQIENTYNQFYNIPNNIRKFLEYYLFYKYPNSESSLLNLDKLFDGHIPALLNRVVNEYSHLTFIDRGWNPIDVPEVEECVRIIIEKIEEKDKEQFEALKQSIGE